MNRSRFATHATVLLAAALGAATVTTVTTVATASAPSASTFVPITPCRLLDTRPGDANVGPRATPLGAGDTIAVDTWGTNGNCTLPSGATALSMNIVSIEPTASSFLTVFPTDAPRPTASSLNWTAGQAPTPNSVTAAVSSSGRLSLFNLAGTVHLAVDVVGYYAPPEIGATGPAGAPGPVGPAGPAGEAGVEPANEIWVAESGGDFTTVSAALASITDASASNPYVIRIAPGVYDEAAGLDMKDHVDLVGSGHVTVLRSSAPGGTVRATSLSFELRDLTVENSNGIGVFVANDSTPAADVSLVDLHVSSVITSNSFNGALSLSGGTIDIDGLTAAATSTTTSSVGLRIQSAEATARDMTIDVSSATTDCVAARFVNSSITLDGMDATADVCAGMGIAVWSSSSSVGLSNATLHATGGPGANAFGLYMTASHITADGMVATAVSDTAHAITIEVNGDPARLIVRNSELHGEMFSIRDWTGNARLFDTVLDGVTDGMPGRCVNALTTALTPFACT